MCATNAEIRKQKSKIIITKIENTTASSIICRGEYCAWNKLSACREKRRTKARCARSGECGGYCCLCVAARSWLQYLGSWKRCARRLPIGQIQAVPGNFLLSERCTSETRLARSSHDLLCRSTSSSSSSPPSLFCRRFFTADFAPESLSYLIISLAMYTRDLWRHTFSSTKVYVIIFTKRLSKVFNKKKRKKTGKELKIT